MPYFGDSLSCSYPRSSDDVCLALNLSVTSQKRSVINLEGKCFAVERIWAPRNNTIRNGMNWRTQWKIEIAARVQPGTACPRGCERERAFFPARGWNSGKGKEYLRRSEERRV